MTIYTFPRYEKSIEADSLREAEQKLKDELDVSHKKIEHASNKDMAKTQKSHKHMK